MKKISKILTPLVTASTATMSLGLVGCNKMANIKQEVLDEFIGNSQKQIGGLTSVPRPSYYRVKIVPYLVNRIRDITGIKVGDIHVQEPGEVDNIYFDLPASKGNEDKDMVILQGHMDMVVAGLTEEEAKTMPIDAVIDGNLIHSKDYKTSIGADNGIGVAIMLALAKHNNDYSHGPLRFLFTADEDCGMIGASKLADDILKTSDGKFVKWLINCDAENLNEICRSCSGNARLTFSAEYDLGSVPGGSSYFDIYIDGLQGGHSAIDILKNRANADRLAFGFLDYLNEHNLEPQIINFDHKKQDGKDISYSSNQLIANSHLIITLPNVSESSLRDLFKNYIKLMCEKYSGESSTVVIDKSHIGSIGSISAKPLSIDDTKKIVQAFGKNKVTDQGNEKKLDSFYYGILDGDFQNNDLKPPKASANIGPIDIWQEENKIKLTGNTSTRSTVGTKDSDEQFSVNWFISEYYRLAQKYNIDCEDGPKYYPWLFNGTNKVVGILNDGYKRQGISSQPIDDPAGLEPAWWNFKTNGQICCGCIGANIDNAHSVTETLYINTIEPVFNCLLYALEHLIK